jgi:hypothetical protein
LLILPLEVANRCPLTWENGVAEATVRPSQEDTCSVRSSHSPDQITVTFDDDHAVADAGLILAASLAEDSGCVSCSTPTSTSATRPARPTPATRP